MANGKLGKIISMPGGPQLVYRAPEDIEYARVNLRIINPNSTSAIVSVHVAEGLPLASEDNYSRNVTIPGNGAFLQETCLSISPGEAIYVQSETPNIVVRCSGMEEKLTSDDSGSRPIIESSIIIPNDHATGDQFGASAAIATDGNTFAFASINKVNSINRTLGAVYLFDRVNLTLGQISKVTAPTSVPETNLWNEFGTSLALSTDGRTLVVGDAKDDFDGEDSGAIYIYSRTGNVLTLATKIKEPTVTAWNQFGSTVALSRNGDMIAVGCPRHNNSKGIVYFYNRLANGQWNFYGAFTPQDPTIEFGTSIKFMGTSLRIAVGCRHDTLYPGRVYIVTYSSVSGSWTQNTRLQPNDGVVGDMFGSSISVTDDGNTLIFGAPRAVTSGANSGAAYMFYRSGAGYEQAMKLAARDASAGAFFGQSVDIADYGSKLIVGAPGDRDSTIKHGAAYVYNNVGDVWVHQSKLIPSDGVELSNFGDKVAITSTGDKAIVANKDAVNIGLNSGAVYLYNL